MRLPTIRPMTPDDVEPIAAAIERAEWGDRRLEFGFATRHAGMHPLVAEADGAPVGTGLATVNGDGRLGRDDLGGSLLARAGRREGVDPGGHRHRRVGRLPNP